MGEEDRKQMKIVVAPDSFKGSLSAGDVCRAVARGIRAVWPDADVHAVPMADGGEGTVQALVDATGGRLVEMTVTGPLGEPVRAAYGILGDGRTAVIEMAAASGLPLVPEEHRNPLITTTYGTGELIRGALDAGCRNVIIGIGGSATVDGGAGMAQALGAGLFDADGRQLPPGGGSLDRLADIDLSGLHPALRETTITIASDVNNPLCGPRGAARVFGPQKGATPEMVEILDRNLGHLARVILDRLGVDVAEVPGAGAAGGLGAGLIAFTGARLRPGVELVIEATGLARRLEGADLVITGEGRIDGQTVHGKAPMGVARLASAMGIPVIAVVGSLGPGAEAVYGVGIDALLPIVPGPVSLQEAMAGAVELTAAATERGLRLMALGHRVKVN